MVDLRSDTVTKPSPAMRQAMAEAEVGDDVFGEDPTVHRLQARVAEVLGKEAALFVPSGVMGNQIALKLHTQPGDEVVVAERSHIYHYESGAPGLISGVQLRPVGDATGILTPEEVTTVVRGAPDWEPRTRLLCLEDTINKAGGRIYPLDTLQAATKAARTHGLALHLDGARLWNAAIATDTPEAEIAAPFDTVNVCLSKGLGAPVGSVLAGSGALMRAARRIRKALGGGMRQVGLLAAAGLYALDHHRAGLADDHTWAHRFADALEATGAFRVVPPETNIVLFDTLREEAETALHRLAAAGIRVVPFGPATLRATFHRDVTESDLTHALDMLPRLYA
ncbi:MAG: aminotransferase class I/II-fold pyridoxal phosphate-dependent enzyme [Rhodothermaceae bacterium]|nr:aminotransferase class I/II-fold pyridoxal phosphate-dependent enzyme [Rhodothermaceae bacterium]